MKGATAGAARDAAKGAQRSAQEGALSLKQGAARLQQRLREGASGVQEKAEEGAAQLKEGAESAAEGERAGARVGCVRRGAPVRVCPTPRYLPAPALPRGQGRGAARRQGRAGAARRSGSAGGWLPIGGSARPLLMLSPVLANQSPCPAPTQPHAAAFIANAQQPITSTAPRAGLPQKVHKKRTPAGAPGWDFQGEPREWEHRNRK